jgi:cell division protein FtsL
MIFETVRNFLGKAARLAYIAEHKLEMRLVATGVNDAN